MPEWQIKLIEIIAGLVVTLAVGFFSAYFGSKKGAEKIINLTKNESDRNTNKSNVGKMSANTQINCKEYNYYSGSDKKKIVNKRAETTKAAKTKLKTEIKNKEGK